MLRLLIQELRFRRNAIIGWAIGLSILPAMYVGIYPQFAEDLEGMQNIMDMDIYKAMGMSFGTFEDWVASTVINIVPIILAIYAVIDGTGTLAGQEDSGKLELIVALPIPRWQIVTVKAIALSVALFIILLIVSLVSAIVFLAIEGQVESDLAAVDMITGLLATWPITFAFAMISMFLAAFCSTRRVAALIATALVIISYFGSNLSNMVSSLEPLRPLFLHTYLDSTGSSLTVGQQASDMVVLLVVGLVAFSLALLFFQRRNITVGAWPWQRAKASA